MAAGLLALLYAAILLLDPYGRRVGPGRPPTPLMDLNQRYMYPQLARSGLFDSAVFGTSTLRLLDPRELDTALGGRFANLAINAGTPWEQMQLATLFLRHVPNPRSVMVGLDRLWCDADADSDRKRLTFRSFPPWLYDEDGLDDLPQLLNFKTLEIASRVALNRLGLMPARIRGDGYEVFTPSENRYDPARIRPLLYPHGALPPAQSPPVILGEADRAASRFPAMAWLATFVAGLPGSTRLVFVFPPLHVAGQPRPGSREAAVDAACKAAAAAAAKGRPAAILDYRRPTALTTADDRFWDQLHYRLPVASRIVRDVADVTEGRPAGEDGVYAVMAPGG